MQFTTPVTAVGAGSAVFPANVSPLSRSSEGTPLESWQMPRPTKDAMGDALVSAWRILKAKASIKVSTSPWEVRRAALRSAPLCTCTNAGGWYFSAAAGMAVLYVESSIDTRAGIQWKCDDCDIGTRVAALCTTPQLAVNTSRKQGKRQRSK